MNNHHYFITGIGTDIGKTIVSAILVEHLNAEYWKPIQAGNLEFTDSDRINELTNCRKIHKERFLLTQPMSPHASAKIDQINMVLDDFNPPKTIEPLIIEGAGGLMVPINNKDMVLNLIKYMSFEVIVVSQHYLGSINHTLLTIEVLKNKGIPIKGIIFNGEPNSETEITIESYTGLQILGRIHQHVNISKAVIINEAKKMNIK